MLRLLSHIQCNQGKVEYKVSMATRVASYASNLRKSGGNQLVPACVFRRCKSIATYSFKNYLS